ncbi:MAG: glycosyl hydrolase [Bacteroidetes bacterium]|nr:MAG: glycosyl hydrolase [Bacteroidota bacterium]
MKVYFTLLASLLTLSIGYAQKKPKTEDKPAPLYDASTVGSIQFRSIGPALTSGRVADIVVHPDNNDKWYVAAASGGIWYTENHGTTFNPIFDGYGSFSIACIELAPSNPNTVWVGTGENNNQRSVAYGDGVYKSVDGGKSFTNMGLKNSEHIGNIIIHPTDENTLWVAAYGPVWSSGGERGVYKSADGGKTWKRTLFVSDETGISEIASDPKDPNILYAAAHQRRRHEWTYIGGGPESTIYKSTDGGETWREINSGLPKGDMGRIGLAVSPVDNNYVYAIVEGRNGKGGFFRSTNKGESWSKMSSYNTSGNYYQEIFCDPVDKNKVFAMDTYMHHTADGGKTFVATGEKYKHVDNHVIWIDPKNTDHWLVGCDGGVYETFTHAREWRYYDNLPIIQYYKVTTDNALPFYNIYGGTQDNNSMGGPSATMNATGILNFDWYITNGGDGFESAVDPEDENVVYAQAQYGWIVRYDKASGEKVPIQPLPGKGEDPYRWNWDAPLLVSPHDHKTLYFAANKVFKSTNRGDDWEVISPDLSKGIDRNKLKVMGQVWSMDAVMKNASTTIYGNIVALDESPVRKGLLYAGTDDGAIQVSENDGKTWTKYNSFAGIPSNTRVNMICASQHDENVVFAVFNNHRSGDFKPYLMKSSDKGKTWTSISSNLPERGSVYCIRQDFVKKDLLFVGTEFGAYFSTDGGKSWTKLGGLPTIAIYDLDIQKRENDLVAASFGRGFYVLDNYSPLRDLTKENLDKKAHMFPIKDARLYVPADPLGLDGTGFQGTNLYAGKNPEFGATFTFYFKDELKSLKDKRQEEEKKLEKDKKDVFYPSFEDIKKEEQEEEMKFIFIIKDDQGKEIKRLVQKAGKGIQRVTWNLRSESTSPSKSSRNNDNNGFLVIEGNYTVEVWLTGNGKSEQLTSAEKFKVVPMNFQTLKAADVAELNDFRNKVAEMSRRIGGTNVLLRETKEKINLYQSVITTYPGMDLTLLEEIRALELQFVVCQTAMYGDKTRTSREFEAYPGISERMGLVEYQLWENTVGVSSSRKRNLEIVTMEYDEMRNSLNNIIKRLNDIEKKLDEKGIPYTGNKGMDWKEE